jgi:RimJ/RimL family protein N-acetyltransferase
MAIHIRSLDPSEWTIFKDFRFRSLEAEPGKFSSSYGREAAMLPQEWQDTITGPDHQVFGLFDQAHLIGITAVFTSREDASCETAILAMSFILPEFRGRNLSRMLYEARLEWIWAHPQFTRVVVSHRDSNAISRRANQRYGFVLSGRAKRKWPDGTTEDEVFYELRISRG